MSAQPTLWQWVTFFVSLALMGYALWLVVASRLPFLDGVGRGAFHAFDRFGRWTIVWFYWPIWKAIRLLARLLWELPGHLWRGPAPAPQPAPVSTISVGLPATYVAGYAGEPHQNAPSAPSVVRPSAPSAADRPVSATVPAPVERLTVDRSREALVEALVAAGWSTTQIREHLKGTNAAIGQEVEAARERLAAPRTTPIAGRVTAAEFRD